MLKIHGKNSQTVKKGSKVTIVQTIEGESTVRDCALLCWMKEFQELQEIMVNAEKEQVSLEREGAI